MSTTGQFFEAIERGDREEVERLLQEDPDLLDAQDDEGLSGVLIAVYHGQPALADLLIERGALLNVFEAAAAGRVEGVRALTDEAPGRVNEVSDDGFQPLGLAAFFGHLPVVELLLERGAEVGTPSQNSMAVQPINSAAAGGHTEIVRRLLDHGADPDARSNEGFTPLHAAAQNGLMDMARLLVERSADPQARAQDKTPADYARAAGHNDVADFLSQAAGRR